MKLLSIGTILEVNKKKLCIIGYTSFEKAGGSVMGYYVVPYPVGFMNIEKIFFIPCDSTYAVIAEGYRTENTEKVLDVLHEGFEAVKTVPNDELYKFVEAYKKVGTPKEETE